MASSVFPPRAANAELTAHNIIEHDFSRTTQYNSDSSTTAEIDHAAMRGKRRAHVPYPPYPSRPIHSSSSRQTYASSSTRAETRAGNVHRDVRTLPTWIGSFEEDGEDSLPTESPGRYLSTPDRAHSARHHHTAIPTSRRISQDGYVDDYEEVPNGINGKKPETGFFGSQPVRGRKWDHRRDGDPVIMRASDQNASPWRQYIKASMYGPGPAESERVDEEFLRQQTPGYDTPWVGDLEGGDSEKLSGLLRSKRRRRGFFKTIQHTFLMHPYVPLVFRLIILTTSVVALGIAASIFHLSNRHAVNHLSPSTIMAIAVDTIAIPYILYITWDEYTGKPLGLRSPKAKIRLVLLDVLFIIFESANLALAFEGFGDRSGVCYNSYQIDPQGGNTFYARVPNICRRFKALSSILFLALITWSMTFAVSIFRLVERVGGREGND